MTTAAIALEEQRAATASTEEATLAASAVSVTAPSVAPIAAPARAARARVLLGAILLVETGWIAALGLFAYKLIT